MENIFEWPRMLMNEQSWVFLLEVCFRTLVMFAISFLAFRFSGKRGIKQLSVFELVLIVSLGSAAGDPMFYHDVGLLPALTVFVVVMLVYRFLTWLVTKHHKIEAVIEGKPVYLIRDGKFCIEDIDKNELAEDEFFAELRVYSIEHVGQVRLAIVETSGEISVYYYENDDVRPGLPLLPHLYAKRSKIILEDGMYSCSFCASTIHLPPGAAQCPTCGKHEWVRSISTKRVV